VFMHQLFVGPESADERIVELDSADDRAQIRHLALAAPASPQFLLWQRGDDSCLEFRCGRGRDEDISVDGAFFEYRRASRISLGGFQLLQQLGRLRVHVVPELLDQ
jgi:hypothetical protein